MCELLPCPYCGSSPHISASFGRLCISCQNAKCLMRPSTWLTALNSTDLKVVGKHWNQRPKEKRV